MRVSPKANSVHSSEFGVRNLHPGDAEALMALRHRAISECAAYFGTPARIELAHKLPHYRAKLVRYAERGHPALIGVWQQGTLTGMTGIRVRRLRHRDRGLIFSTFIEKPFRGKGLAKALVREAQAQIRQRWALEHCMIQVEVFNRPALQLYQGLGFHITDTQERAFWIDGVAHDVFVLEG